VGEAPHSTTSRHDKLHHYRMINFLDVMLLRFAVIIAILFPRWRRECHLAR
jgi:hypothetical protein